MKIWTLTILAVLALLYGCSAHYDKYATYHITGDVFDKSTNAPLDKVQVVFTDIDMNYSWSGKHNSTVIGESYKSAKIDLIFGYGWGITKNILNHPKETFEIELNRDGYEHMHFLFKAPELPYDAKANKTEVNLNKVYLDPKR